MSLQQNLLSVQAAGKSVNWPHWSREHKLTGLRALIIVIFFNLLVEKSNKKLEFLR